MREKLSRVLTSIILITLIAFSLRMLFFVHETSLAPAEALAVVPFQNEAGNIALSLSQGNGFCCLFRESTGPTAWLAPVYPLLLAAIFKAFVPFTIHAFYAAVAANCIFTALVCIPLFSVAKRVAGLLPAAIAAWVWALLPSGIIIPFEWIWDTSLSALLAITLLWATLRLAESSRLADAAWYGLLWGFSLLTNPALATAFPFFLSWIALRQSRTNSWRPATLFLSFSLAVACCIPWTIHNYTKFHRLIPLRSNFAFELWLGNNEIFDEHSRGINRITRYEEVHRYSQLGESAFLEEKSQQARSFIRQKPVLFLKLTGRRIIATWLGTENPLHDFFRADSFFVRFIFVCNALLLLGLLAGSYRLAINRNSFFFPLAVFPLIFPAVYYITHTSLRYRHPLDPILALFVALAIGVPATTARKSSRQTL